MFTNLGRRPRGGRRERVETLEPRRLLAVTPLADPGPLVVTGTDGDDAIDVSPSADGSQVVVTVNGTPTAADASGVQRVDVSGLAGNDVLTISPALTMPVNFDGGAGTLDRLELTGTANNDTFDLLPTQLSLNGRVAATYTSTVVEQVRVNGAAGDDLANAPPGPARGPRFAFDGGDGTDRLVVMPDQAVSQALVYTISPTSIEAGEFGGRRVAVNYSGVETADVFGARQADTFSVLGTPAGTSITLHGGEGSDGLTRLRINNSFLDLSTLEGGLTYDAGPPGGDIIDVG
jgi:hypothetical protein